MAFLLIAFPAWAYILFGDLSGRKDGLLDALAFGAFMLVALAAVWTEVRNRRGGQNG
jgi:hypothetical protein